VFLHRLYRNLVYIAAEAVGAGQVEVAVEAGGICGSDLHYFNHGGFGTVRVREPMILGHEVAGTVKALGTAVSGLARSATASPFLRAGPATLATIA
jgi:D-arabinose 1-dehydrogenase-like Zn-dependent alcohol dehydrogenase